MGNPDVDEYMKNRLTPEQQEIVTALRELMAECAPDAAEVIKFGSPAWQQKKILAIISSSKTHITFAFERGAEFEDAHGLLAGVGKQTRHVKIKKPDQINREALRDYIAQAIKVDSAN
ncbi:DUF1801 domain-containing protein [Microbispora sp. H11081]|uniref:DUF1801 domain-containing protein n=1 Tax=Microbispora sp. H11081 TaxID=2729107 RepID=UPI001475F66E|nr:DUF1801 domain-containing protein [Microbispora sp. H11081]